MLVWNYDPPTYPLTRIKSRATSLAIQSNLWRRPFPNPGHSTKRNTCQQRQWWHPNSKTPGCLSFCCFPNCIIPNCIFAKCTRLFRVLSVARWFLTFQLLQCPIPVAAPAAPCNQKIWKAHQCSGSVHCTMCGKCDLISHLVLSRGKD